MARIAEHFANTLGVDWLEARVAGSINQKMQTRQVIVEGGLNINCQETNILNNELLSWPDLFIVIGQESSEVQDMPLGVRQKNWPLTDFFESKYRDSSSQNAYLSAEVELKNRIRSMINGMRMFSKSD